MAAQVGVTYVIIFYLNLTLQMAALKYYNNLVNFDLPDGSTSWGYICYYILVKFDLPDGSTS